MVVGLKCDTEGERRAMPDMVDPEAGTRLTYIAASQIARVDLRIEWLGSYVFFGGGGGGGLASEMIGIASSL